jgi:chromate reductase, NAD(P)H dehydrogenase (quinone)
MNRPYDVAVLVGSLRRESLTRKVAQTLISVSPPSFKSEIVEIGQLPHYNADLESTPPAEWLAFRERLARAEAVLFVTPEYNRSVPGVLKNAVDVASRPPFKHGLNGKPGAIVSVSPGALSGFGANHHLRQSLVFVNVPTMQQPEAYIGGADKLFDAQGMMTNEGTREFLRKFMAAFEQWIARFSA